MATTFLTRLKPEAKGIYSADTAYDANCLVTSTDGVRVYLSVKDAPAGTPLTDTNYFVIHTDLSATVQSAEDAAQKAAAAREEMLEIARGLTDAVEASGNPVQLELAGAIPFDSVETVLKPVQAGSGDPSPENIRAISGWTGVKLNTAGAQLLDDTNLSGIVLGTIYRCDNPFKVAGTYTISIHITGGTEQGVTFAIRSASGNIAQYSVRSGTPVVMEVTEDILQNLDHCMIYVFSGSTGATLDWIMVNAGDTALPYEPYQGNTYTAEFGDAVYGGMMNWTTGEMTVDRGFYAFTGNERVSAVNLTNSDSVKQILFYNMDAQNAMASGDEICSHYLFNSLATSGMFVGFKISNASQWSFGISVDTLLQYGSADNNTIEEWVTLAKAFFADQYAAGTPIQVAYKLAEPYTIQMTPQEIKQLNGTNTLYGDGTVQLQGRERPGQND